MMKITIYERDLSKVAVVSGSEIILSDLPSALDLMATISHAYECNKMVVHQSNICEDFFRLKTRLAGEILQKYTNYHFRIAIVGNFEIYDSQSLQDFIYESNQGKQVLFMQSEQAAIDALHDLQ